MSPLAALLRKPALWTAAVGGRVDRILDRRRRVSFPQRIEFETLHEADQGLLSRAGALSFGQSIDELLERQGSGHTEPRLHRGGDEHLGRLCYGGVRALEPATVLEIGVARGRSTACILQGLADVGAGVLHSIDLPPFSAKKSYVGELVPLHLRESWTLHVGSSRRFLDCLKRQGMRPDLTVIDGSHTYRGMWYDISMSVEMAAPGGMLLCDDVAMNSAFQEVCKHYRERIEESFVVNKSSGGYIGLCLLR